MEGEKTTGVDYPMRRVLYIVFGGVILLTWCMLGKPFLDNLVASGTLDPTLGFFAFWGMFALAVRIAVQSLGGVITRPHMLSKTSLASMGLIWGGDIIIPPYMVSWSGGVVTSIADGWYKVDWQLGRLLNLLPIPSELIYILVYFVIGGTLGIGIPVMVFKHKKLRKKIGEILGG